MSRLKEDQKAERKRQDDIDLAGRVAKRSEVERYDTIAFFKRHLDLALEANAIILLDYLDSMDLATTLDNLEFALEECRDRLAVKEPEEYVRKTEPGVPMAQQKPVKGDPTNGPRPVVLPYSREEILKMTAPKLRQLMKRKEYLEELNRILGLRR